ncbi:hypothetical protein OIU84_017520 [Salix udensis]|uniref:Uncharacterized protein n=1 Tax=Salix udensis TaxID=889485 RepID=A0AAD6L387_9ROSI|nr:hypothetical protein OIU84_017520 [Salix udensis]
MSDLFHEAKSGLMIARRCRPLNLKQSTFKRLMYLCFHTSAIVLSTAVSFLFLKRATCS